MKLSEYLHSILKTQHQTRVNSVVDGEADFPDKVISGRQKQFVYRGQSHDRIPSDVIHATVHPWTRKIKRLAFQNTSESLQSMVIPSRVKIIELEAFRGCASLVDLQLSRGLERIQCDAFHSCISLIGRELGGVQTLSIPATVETIGCFAFADCKSLVNVQFQGGPESLDKGVFCNCASLVYVKLPLRLKLIHSRVFFGCVSLTDIELPQSLKSIGTSAFEDCISLTNMSFPKGLRKIGECSFCGCISLVEVEFQEGLTTIYSEAFFLCTSLSAVAFPSTIYELFFRVFADCTSLLGAEFPLNSTVSATRSRFYLMYSENLFSGCKSLVNLSLPSYVVDETDAFPVCDLLQDYGAGVKNRYAHLPVHEACYNSSSAKVDDLIIAIDSSEIVVGDFGLTPFHIVATSANPRVEILEYLLDMYSFDVLCQRDNSGKTMLDYLLMYTPSKVVPLIQMVLQKSVLDRMSEWDIEAKWDSILSQGLESIPRDSGGIGAVGRQNYVYACFFAKLGQCMRTKMTSLLELALWKFRLRTFQNGKADSDSDNDFRQQCRLQNGAGVVLENVAEYLWIHETLSGTALSSFPLCSLTVCER